MRTPPAGKAYQAKNAYQMKSSIFRRLVLAGLLFFASAVQAERYTVPLLVPAGTSSEPQGVVRILNGTDESGTVEIYAINDAGARSGPATFTLNASAAVQFTATDLASGNATLGVTGGIGTDVGDARLEIETDLSIVPLAFVRAADGTLSAMHDTVRGAAADGAVGYTCTSPAGCSVVNGTVTRGTVAGRAAGSGEVDYFPTFRTAVSPGDQTYTVGTAIDTLPLPEANSGNAPLSYNLTPSVPGLTFNAATPQLTGTPSTAGAYAMTYTVTDEDGDTDTLSFAITVNTDRTETGSLGECYVSLSVSIGQSCTYPGTTDAFSVNDRGRGSFLTFLAGIRIRITNQTINGRVYDFEASHQGDGVWRIDRIAGSTEAPATPPTTGGGGMVDTGDGDDDDDDDTDDVHDGVSDIDDPFPLDRDNACSAAEIHPRCQRTGDG